MLDKLGSAFSAMKNAAVENAARNFFNRYVENFGSVTRIEIDTQQKKLAGELSLKGEPGPVTLSVGRYELSESGGETWITLYDCGASREWVAGALKQYLEGRRIRIPSALKLAL